jgi:hypothetical protein
MCINWRNVGLLLYTTAVDSQGLMNPFRNISIAMSDMLDEINNPVVYVISDVGHVGQHLLTNAHHLNMKQPLRYLFIQGRKKEITKYYHIRCGSGMCHSSMVKSEFEFEFVLATDSRARETDIFA